MKKYKLKNGQMQDVGDVNVDDDGNWTYKGKDGGASSGTSNGLPGGKRAFYSPGRGRVAIRNNDGSCEYEDTDPQTSKPRKVLGALK